MSRDRREDEGQYYPGGKALPVRPQHSCADWNDITGKPSTFPPTGKGAANGVAELDASGKVPSSQLPTGVYDPAGTATAAVSAHDTDARHVVAGEKAVWGAKYNKPASGIPKTDMASDVQASLGKADTALQNANAFDPAGAATGAVTTHDTDARHVIAGEKAYWNGKYTKPSGGVPRADLSSGVRGSLQKADDALQEADVVPEDDPTLTVKIATIGNMVIKAPYAQIGNVLEGESMKTTPTQRELTAAVKKIWEKLGGAFITCFLVMVAAAEVTRNTEWQDVPPEALVGSVVDLSRAGVDTNVVNDLIRPATNAVAVELRGEIAAHSPGNYASVSNAAMKALTPEWAENSESWFNGTAYSAYMVSGAEKLDRGDGGDHVVDFSTEYNRWCYIAVNGGEWDPLALMSDLGNFVDKTVADSTSVFSTNILAVAERTTTSKIDAAKTYQLGDYDVLLSDGQIYSLAPVADMTITLALGNSPTNSADAILWVTNVAADVTFTFAPNTYNFIVKEGGLKATANKRSCFSFVRVNDTDVIVSKEEY